MKRSRVDYEEDLDGFPKIDQFNFIDMGTQVEPQMSTYYIEKEVSLQNVKAKYQPAVDEVKERVLALTEKIHSLYLYGSVATGKAKSPTSDLDILVVMQEPLAEELNRKFVELGGKLSQKYEELFREVGIGVTDVGEVLHGDDPLGWRFFMQVLCVKLHGDDLYDEVERFQPTTQLARELQSDLSRVLKSAITKIETHSGFRQKLAIRAAMKKIIRAAFGLVMERENYWTVDLSKMKEICCKHYAERAEAMDEVQKLLHEEEPSSFRAIVLIKQFGSWLEIGLLEQEPTF